MFVDESGGKGQGRHMCLLGLMADSAAWAEFSDRWRAALDEPPAIKAMHMVEAIALKDAFRRWAPDDRDAKIRRMISALNQTPTIGLFSLFDQDAWWRMQLPLRNNKVRSRRDKLNRVGRDPYFLGFSSMIVALAVYLQASGQKERVELIFDENRVSGYRAREWYPALRELLTPEEQAIMPIDVLFRSDDEFVPLQAADLLASPLRRTLEQEPATYGWVHEQLTNVSWIAASPTYDIHRIGQMLVDSVKSPIDAEMRERLDRALGLEE